MPIRFEQKTPKHDYDKFHSIMADLFLVFSGSNPWLILYALRRKSMTLSEISESLRIAQKAVLPELLALERKGILVSFSKSQKTLYRLADARILRAFDRIHDISLKKAKQAETKNPAHKTSRISQRSGI
jgi:predicted transcriptional regulator